MPLPSRRTLLGISLLLAGCGGSSPPGGSPGTAASLASRMEAARGIVNMTIRDQAYVALAADAAGSGDATLAHEAVKSIVNAGDRDAAASSAALLLAKRGKGSEATALARLIFNMATRDETLAKIARGDSGK